ncbi:MAG: rhodanese-like domain-containing protein [Flavobacteriales bacterium]|nr:rhodanese-like domain-containing protein [Flavobacteriales bacterium]
MKYALSFLMMMALLSCNAQQNDHATSNGQQEQATSIYTDVSNAEAMQLMAERPNLLIIDVRTDGEVSQGIIEGAEQIDISKASFDSELAKLDKSAPVLVYCAAGGRSKTAQNKMKAMGFKEVHNLSGGYSDWK